jgi:hypothetical protein
MRWSESGFVRRKPRIGVSFRPTDPVFRESRVCLAVTGW